MPTNPDDNPGGRPRKLSLPLIDAAVRLLLTGMAEAGVCRRLLVGARTWKKWKALGRQYPEGVYGTFLHRVVAAKEEFHAKACRAIDAGMETDPRLALEVLARRYPRLYGQHRGEIGRIKRRLKELEKLLGEAAGEPAPG